MVIIPLALAISVVLILYENELPFKEVVFLFPLIPNVMDASPEMATPKPAGLVKSDVASPPKAPFEPAIALNFADPTFWVFE